MAFADVQKPTAFDALCASCHHMEGPDQVGPTLGKMIGAPIGASTSFPYSTALKGYATLNRIWTAETLRAFLQNPMQAVPGTAMSFAGVDDEDTLNRLIDYLGDPAMVTHSDEAIAISKLEADPEYGEYLASECLTCHQADGGNSGIASIVGRDEVDF
ncbi:MAG: cytochrome C, partial [Gammaproteobacteria bacterium]|nr:cytochrome C [Gammaproteobacteria bacterium]